MRFGAGDETGEGGEGRYLAKTTLSLKSMSICGVMATKRIFFFFLFFLEILFFFCAQNKLYQNVGPSQVKRGNAELW